MYVLLRTNSCHIGFNVSVWRTYPRLLIYLSNVYIVLSDCPKPTMQKAYQPHMWICLESVALELTEPTPLLQLFHVVFLCSRCSIFPLSGSSRTVRRILTACLLSLLALLGSVSIDLSSHFELLHSTEAAYDELTSCRTIAILQLVSKLQKMRHLFAKHTGNETLEDSFSEVLFPVFGHLCGEMAGYSNSYGLSCSVELVGFCQEMKRSTQGFLNTSMYANSTSEQATSAFTEVIGRLLDIWGTVEDTLVKVKTSSNWRDVLSARLLVTFIELNHQLMEFPHMAANTDFQYKWTYVLSYLGFAKVLTEQLNDCWLENIDLKLNSSQHVKHSYMLYDSSLWQISGAGTDLLSGSRLGIQALTNTQQCLFESAVPALRLVSRSVSSGLSMRICLLAIACLIYPVVMLSFKQMTEWIQNYAQSLKERTEDLKRQRQLAEDLLNQMLPKSVAKQLRQQKHVQAESYEKVGADYFETVKFVLKHFSKAVLNTFEKSHLLCNWIITLHCVSLISSFNSSSKDILLIESTSCYKASLMLKGNYQEATMLSSVHVGRCEMKLNISESMLNHSRGAAWGDQSSDWRWSLELCGIKMF